ncbi:MAG: GntR family transcriptional regulator [Alphaproteobacteria bacterium]
MTTDEHPARKLPPRRADVEITSWLRDSIIEGDIPPGSRLSETSIGNERGVSRTPVREALRVLASEDLIVWQPNRSAVVKQISDQAVIEALDLLGALEELAVRLVATLADDEQMARLEVAYARFRRRALDPEIPKYFGVNMHLHLALVEASGNEMLMRFHKAVVTQLIRARQTVNITGRSMSSSLQDHGDLMEAVFSRNPRAAQNAVMVHIEAMKRTLVLGDGEQTDPDGANRQ